MFFIQYQAAPSPDRPDVSAQYGGAIINCWVDRPTAAEAEVVSRKLMESNGWRVVEKMDCSEVSPTTYKLSDEAIQYFEQATIDGEVLVIFTYPVVETGQPEN